MVVKISKKVPEVKFCHYLHFSIPGVVEKAFFFNSPPPPHGYSYSCFFGGYPVSGQYLMCPPKRIEIRGVGLTRQWKKRNGSEDRICTYCTNSSFSLKLQTYLKNWQKGLNWCHHHDFNIWSPLFFGKDLFMYQVGWCVVKMHIFFFFGGGGVTFMPKTMKFTRFKCTTMSNWYINLFFSRHKASGWWWNFFHQLKQTKHLIKSLWWCFFPFFGYAPLLGWNICSSTSDIQAPFVK